MSKSRMSQQALAAALTTALLAFTAPTMVFAQDEGSDRSSRADRASRSGDRSERRSSRQAPQKAEALYPNSSREEPGIAASQRLLKQLNTLSEANNESDAAKGLPVADEILANSAANTYDKSMAALLAGQLLLNEDNARAVTYLDQAIETGGLDNNNHFQAMLIVAQLQAQENQYEQALASLDRYITESGSTDPKDQALKGNLLYRLERYPEAIATLKPLVDAGGEVDPQWQQILMASYAESGNSAEATRLAEQVAQATPDDKRSQVNLAVSYLQTDQNDKAIEVFERLRAAGQLTEESEYRNLYALYLNSENKEREAIAVINEGLQKNILKEDYRTMAALGQANYFSDQIEPAIAAWRKAAPLAENGDTYLNLARVLHQEGRSDEAKEAARQAIAKGLKSNTDAERIISGR
ncbi:conserved exported hypothetical protein [Luteimonas sp. 9C]|uniref:tetratricopeptide repeat protein n=1 Tax=Luteimonas sp. 9C TaxID=2653148 RepID=UPI0012F1B17B|nr:tetratricopeptide repeat protein [Luteimonas sp. 9C]VXB10006.1 conserved exported hypothetical protein [Luteimonas sp. 9C]